MHHAPPTPTDLADRAAICLSKHARTIFCEAAHRRRRRWVRLATYGILEESRVASRRSLLVFRRGVRRCCEHERAAGAFSKHVGLLCCCNQSRQGLLGGITFRSLDNAAVAKRLRKYIHARQQHCWRRDRLAAPTTTQVRAFLSRVCLRRLNHGAGRV